MYSSKNLNLNNVHSDMSDVHTILKVQVEKAEQLANDLTGYMPNLPKSTDNNVKKTADGLLGSMRDRIVDVNSLMSRLEAANAEINKAINGDEIGQNTAGYSDTVAKPATAPLDSTPQVSS